MTAWLFSYINERFFVIMMQIRLSAKIVLPLIFAVVALVAFAEAAAEHACHEEAGGSFAGRDRVNISRTAGRALWNIGRRCLTFRIFKRLLVKIKRLLILTLLFFQALVIMAQRELGIAVERGLVGTDLCVFLL